MFDKIIVSSDSSKICEISKKYNCLTHLRSSKLSDDYTDTTSVVINVIKEYSKLYNFNKVCCIYPTSVFLTEKNLIEAFKKLKKKNNYIFSAAKYSHPIQRSFFKKKDKISMSNKNFFLKRTQDLVDHYHDAGQFYLGWKSSWLQRKIIFNGPNDFIELSESSFHDIDNLADWKIACKKWKYLKKL